MTNERDSRVLGRMGARELSDQKPKEFKEDSERERSVQRLARRSRTVTVCRQTAAAYSGSQCLHHSQDNARGVASRKPTTVTGQTIAA